MQKSGALKLGEYTGNKAKGRVFAGGSVEHLNQMLGVRGSEVLYVGDHIFGDVLKTKKLRGWKCVGIQMKEVIYSTSCLISIILTCAPLPYRTAAAFFFSGPFWCCQSCCTS